LGERGTAGVPPEDPEAWFLFGTLGRGSVGGDGPSRQQPVGVYSNSSDLLEADCETGQVDGEKTRPVPGKLRVGLTGGD
jgi:hypothetical protein